VTYDMSIRPKAGEYEGLDYVLTLSGASGEKTRTYRSITAVQEGLSQAGFSMLRDRVANIL
jgi:hypothetical protein